MESGSFTSRLDYKGRLFVPGYFREKLLGGGQEEVVLVSGSDGCIELLSQDAWREREAAIRAFPRDDPEWRQAQREKQLGKKWCRIDSLGRVTIPINLRRTGGLSRQVVLFENAGFIEIWDKKRWKDYWAAAKKRPAAQILEERGRELPDDVRSKL